MAIKTCVVCNNEFFTRHGGALYCCEACAKKGKTIRRKQWERRTNYVAKQREAARKRRQADAELLQRTTSEAQRKTRAEAEEDKRLFLLRQKEDLKRRADQGDPLARMNIAAMYSAEYWEAYRDYLYQFSAELGAKEPKTIVNGIPITDPDFVSKVLESRTTLGSYTIGT